MNWKDELTAKCYPVGTGYTSTNQMLNLADALSITEKAVERAEQRGIQRAIDLCNNKMRTLPEPSERLSFYVAVEQELHELLKEVGND